MTKSRIKSFILGVKKGASHQCVRLSMKVMNLAFLVDSARIGPQMSVRINSSSSVFLSKFYAKGVPLFLFNNLTNLETSQNLSLWLIASCRPFRWPNLRYLDSKKLRFFLVDVALTFALFYCSALWRTKYKSPTWSSIYWYFFKARSCFSLPYLTALKCIL